MTVAKPAGPEMIRHTPYEGTDPHGMMLETFYTTATIDGNTGDLIVKRNFGPEGVSADVVLADPDKHLGAYTVMFRREAGFDPEDKDWFWVKYLPDGSLDKMPDGMPMAELLSLAAPFGGVVALDHRPVLLAGLIGGVLSGIGAGLNGACSFSTLSRLAEGHLAAAGRYPCRGEGRASGPRPPPPSY